MNPGAAYVLYDFPIDAVVPIHKNFAVVNSPKCDLVV